MTSKHDKLIWVRADHLPDYEQRKRVVSTALENGYSTIVIRKEDDALRRLGRYRAVVIDEEGLYDNGEKIGEVVEIRSGDDLERAYEKRGVENLVVLAKDWKVIPLENLIAELQSSATRLIACASSPEEARLFLETLEVGVDGVLIEPESPTSVLEFPSPSSLAAPEIDLLPAKVTDIRPLASGDRVCVDTCSLMRVGEGMLVGSQSSCLFLVASEAMESEYVASRPFRVNAGAVHAYILTPGGRTRYLSEIRGGDEVLVVDREGRSRSVVVGRSKVERRPLLMVEAELEGGRYSTIVQNAETIRLCTPDGTLSVSDLNEGDEVLVRLEEGGRHFGKAIRESIKEK